MNTTIQKQIIHWDRTSNKSKNQDLLGEEPLSIRIQGNPYSVVMRTPGDEIELVAGFCLTEGIIDTPDDYKSLAFCDGEDTNTVAVTLVPSRREQISQILDRRGFISQTSCGLCGKEIVKDLFDLEGDIEFQKGDVLKNFARFFGCDLPSQMPLSRELEGLNQN